MKNRNTSVKWKAFVNAAGNFAHNRPTRITPHTQTLLDVILVSPNCSVSNSGVIHRPISDHSIGFAKLKIKKQKTVPQYVTTRSYKHYNGNQFAYDLAKEADALLTTFDKTRRRFQTGKLNGHSTAHTRLTCPSKTNQDSWQILSICQQRNQRYDEVWDILLKKFVQTRDGTDWRNFKQSRDRVKKMLRDTENNYTFHDVQANKNSPRALWKIINRAVSSKENQQSSYAKDLSTIANEFKLFFSKVGQNAAEASQRLMEKNNITARLQLSDTNPSSNTPGLFNLKSVSCEEVRRVVKSLPIDNSPGPDKVTARVLKDCLDVILGPLTDIINCSILTSSFPAKWKEAEVIPILKDGDHEVAANNRPISLLPIASKVCERIVLDQFNSYLTENKLLTSHQSGNKKSHSTETLNKLLIDNILEAMNDKTITALVLLDLSKAFDSINHEKLLVKLSTVGASPSTVEWFRSYLSNRRQ